MQITTGQVRALSDTTHSITANLTVKCSLDAR